MEYEQHLHAVETEFAVLLAAMQAGPIDTTIPSCPGWTVADLAEHIGSFAGWWAEILREGTGRTSLGVAEVPPPVERIDWCRQLARALQDELEATPASTEVWTWVDDDRTAGFVGRRCAHELAIHRVDAQLTRGAHEPIEGELAADGIDEIFVMIANRDQQPGGAGETLHLHATDRDAEWTLTFGPGAIEVRHEHAKGDAAIRASASDLELLLYQRPTIGPVEQFGKSRPLALFYGVFAF